MTKEARNPKPEKPRFLDFVIRISFVIRHLDFFRHSDARIALSQQALTNRALAFTRLYGLV